MYVNHSGTTASKPHRNLGPLEVLVGFWRERRLIKRLAVREILSRYRGSIIGLGWSIITPLMMVTVYTFVFSVVFQAKWKGTTVADQATNHLSFGVTLFAGLIVYQVFAECLTRAPSMILENPTYIKKIVFPLETLPWVVLTGALFNFAAALIVLIVVHTVLLGLPPASILLLPVVLIPLSLLCLSVMWIFSSVGVYIRDLSQVVNVLVTLVMFMCPVFYSLEMVPEQLRGFMYLNPMTLIVVTARGLAIKGAFPTPWAFVLYTLGTFLLAWASLMFFRKVKKGFADVI